MLKMGSHDPFGYLKHKLWPKVGPEIKLPIWLLTTKSQESPWFICMKVTCHIPLERSRQGLQICFKPHHNWRCKKNYGPPKSQKSQFWEFQDSNLGIPRQNEIWVLAPWPGIENAIRGKVVASPKCGRWWVTHSQLLKGAQMWAQVKKNNGKGGVRACSLAHNPLRGRGAGWNSGMGLGRVDKL